MSSSDNQRGVAIALLNVQASPLLDKDFHGGFKSVQGCEVESSLLGVVLVVDPGTFLDQVFDDGAAVVPCSQRQSRPAGLGLTVDVGAPKNGSINQSFLNRIEIFQPIRIVKIF